MLGKGDNKTSQLSPPGGLSFHLVHAPSDWLIHSMLFSLRPLSSLGYNIGQNIVLPQLRHGGHIFYKVLYTENSKEEAKDQKTIYSSTTPNLEHHRRK